MPAGLLALKMKIRSSCHLLWASLVLINHFPSVPSARINGQWTEIRTREFDSHYWEQIELIMRHISKAMRVNSVAGATKNMSSPF